MSRLLKSTLFIAVLSFSLFSLVGAQAVPGINDPVTVSISPEFPKPGEIVSVTARSFSTDLNRASFEWMVNGKSFKKGVGMTSIDLPAGKSGSETDVVVYVDTLDIGSITKSISWNPADISILWQSDGYTPPFYKGKALESYGATFKVVAVPEFFGSNGKRIDPKALVYSWKKNGTVDAGQSGYGRNYFIGSQSSYLRGGDTISVEVSTRDNSIRADGSVTISPTVPDIVLYENSPLYGIRYEKAVADTFNLSAEEVTLRAEPFNMSATSPFSQFLTLDWSINGASVPMFQNMNEITLRKAGNVGGQSLVGLVIQHKSQVLQGGQANLTILQ